MNPPFFSTIILQYNNSEDTKKCLVSLLKNDYKNFQTIVVDNNSSEEHKNNITNFVDSQDKIKYIQNGKNLGYSGGNNVGIIKALKNNSDYILILNNDTIVSPDFFNKLSEYVKSNPDIDISSPEIIENSKIIRGAKIKWIKAELSHSEKSIKQKNLYIPGTAMLIKKNVFKKIGLLDERYFLYFEDADFSQRAKKQNLKLSFMDSVRIKHTVSVSTKKIGSPKLLRYHIRNSLLFNLLHAPILIKILIPIWSIIISLKQLIKILFISKKREKSIAILKGVIDFYGARFGKI